MRPKQELHNVIRRRQLGFTLVELMFAVGIVGVLTAIALPSYTENVRQSRRTAAKTTLVEAAQWMERFRAENNAVYTGAALPAGMSASPSSGTPFYDVTLSDLAAGTYQLNATPRAGGPMAADVCGVLTVANDGRRTAAGASTGSIFDRCWNR
jgi:type IV pilus assembly protein PilE